MLRVVPEFLPCSHTGPPVTLAHLGDYVQFWWTPGTRPSCSQCQMPLAGLYPGKRGRVPDDLWVHQFPQGEVRV